MKPAHSSKIPLRVSNFVVELEIVPKRKAETYEKGVTCDIIDPSKQPRLGRITEDGEYEEWQDDFEARFEQQLQRATADRQPRRSSTNSHLRERNERQKNAQKEQKEEPEFKVVEVPKAEAEAIIRTAEFQGFFDKGSRMIERALGQEFDLMESFFVEDEGDKDQDRLERGSKLTKKFTFQEEV